MPGEATTISVVSRKATLTRRTLAAASPRPEAVERVVVDEAGRLHEGVADRRADEAKAALLQILAQGTRLRCLGRDLAHGPPRAENRLAVHEAPEIGIEAAELVAHLQHP